MAGLKQFSHEDVLSTALQTFWRKGYRATSVGDPVAATGLSRSSLYAEFENKRGLFFAVWEHYSVGVTEWLHPLETGDRGLVDLEEFLDGLVELRVGPR